jgi:dTDP-4-dehydrorhamnose reductase
MKLLIVGCNGQLGWELQKTLAPLGEVTAVDYPEVDLTKPASITAAVRAVSPQVIVNSAAYTAVDRAEKEPEIAALVNAEAPALLAREAAQLGAAFVHYSTDYVFDGAKDGPYLETDTPNPQNVYGKTKLAGEEGVAASGARHLILRTSWVYSDRSTNFLLTVLRLAAEREQLRMVADQRGTPTWARVLARTTAAILQQEIARGENRVFAHAGGLYHATGAGVTTWHGFTEAILEQYRKHAAGRPPLKTREVVPIATEDYPLPAPRPKNSVLSNQKLAQVFGVAPVPWQEQLAELMSEMFGG